MTTWTPKSAAGRSNRRIAAIEKHLQNIAYDYVDVDDGIGDMCDRIIVDIEDLTERVAEALAEGRSL